MGIEREDSSAALRIQYLVCVYLGERLARQLPVPCPVRSTQQFSADFGKLPDHVITGDRQNYAQSQDRGVGMFNQTSFFCLLQLYLHTV